MNPFTSAADYMALHGWTQGVVRNPYNGKVCSYGALLYGNPAATERQMQHLVGWLARFIAPRLELDLYPSSAQLIPYWNDRIATSQEQAVALLREAAEAWELENALAATADPDEIEVPEPWMPSLTAIESGFTLDSWVPVSWALPPAVKELATV